MNGRRRVVVGVLLGLAIVPTLSGCALTAAEPDDSRVAEVGRIVDVDAQHSYAIVEFANRRMFVNLDKRDLGKYLVGDELRVDSYGRPLPPRPRSPRPS